MVMRGGIWHVNLAGRSDPDGSQKASLRFVSPDFLKTISIPLRQGRDISESDTAVAPYVAVVSESFVRRYWPGQNPLGRSFNMAFSDRTIVGVVGDVHVRGLEQASEPQVYVSYRQVPDSALWFYNPKSLVVRSTFHPEELTSSVRAIVQKVDPEIPLSQVQMLQDVLDSETASRKAQIRILCAFTGLSLLLAGIGIHGLLAYSVSQRSAEIGVRMALGARSHDVVAMVLRRGVQAATLGGILGIVTAYAAGRWMQSLLAGVAPNDAATFAAATLLAFLTTVSGCVVPAVRAVRVDPAAVMRTE
jgi:predicted permease